MDDHELAECLQKTNRTNLNDSLDNARRLKKVSEESFQLNSDLSVVLQRILNMTMQYIKFIEGLIKVVDKCIAEEAKKHPEVAVLRSNPGIGPVFANGITAEIAGIGRFLAGQKYDRRKKQIRNKNLRDADASVAKYAGLWWPRNASGDFESDERLLTKTGNRYLRYYLIEAADRLVARLFKLAQQTRDPALLTLAYLQVSPFYQGKMRDARMLLERAAASKDINQQRFLAHRFGFAPAAMALTYLSNCLWLMGFPQQAESISIQAFEMAKIIGQPMTTCYVTSRACWMGVLKSDLEQVQEHAYQLNQVAARYGFKNFAYAAIFFLNWVKFMRQEDSGQAIEAMNEVIEAYYATKTVLNRTAFLVYFAQACLVAGKSERGLDRVLESITLGEKTGELWFQAEAWRTKG